MNGIQTIQAALASTQWLFSNFLDGLSDADLLVRPVPGANHLAWQIGHVTMSEIAMVKSQLPDAVYPALPAGWEDTHNQQTVSKDGPEGFRTKAEYIEHFNAVRKATLEVIGGLNDADLDRPSQGRMAPFAPRLGDFFMLVANHTMMHAGQFSVVRRKLGKPVLF